MSTRSIGERSGSDVESTGPAGATWREAALDVWYAWVVGAAALVAAGYFSLSRQIWPHVGELFYALIFAVVAVAALGYGVYEVRSRTSPI